MHGLHLSCLLALTGLVLSGCTLGSPSAQSDGVASVPAAQAYIEPEDDTLQTSPEPNAPIWQAASDGSGLQHIASGFVCPAEQGEFLRAGDETFPGLGRGNDVACLYRAAGGGVVRLHLTHFGRDVSPSAHLKGVQTQIAEAEAILSDAPLPFLNGHATIENAVAYQISARSTLRPAVPIHTAVWIAETGTWHIKARATYEADRGEQIGELVGVLFATAESGINRKPVGIPPQR